MKKVLSLSLTLFAFLMLTNTKESNAQVGFWWENVNGNIHNLNTGGDVLIDNTLRWANEKSFLSIDQGGSIELGTDDLSIPTFPYIDFHRSDFPQSFVPEDYNTRIMNSADNQLDFITKNGATMTLKGNATRFQVYTLPSLTLTNNFNTNNSSGNSLKFQNRYGTLGIDFWNFGANGVMNFYADYSSKAYNQFSIKGDNTCGWGNDQSWLSADQGGSIHLNKAGLGDPNASPFIDFSHGIGLGQNIDMRIISSTENTLDFLPGGGTKIMSVKSDGVYAKKLTVQTNWSDFVFKPDYNLKSLDEVETFIKENGHLEGIPSEQEVAENGVDVGNASAKLLQKIEELTLYVIEMNKQLETLKKENEEMKTLINNK